MNSPLLALFVRSVREDARARSTYIARGALMGFILCVMLATSGFSSSRAAPGLAFFKTITFLQTLFITLAGIGYFSSAITEEKEEEMLGLLRMTNLNPLSILLGKSTSRLVGALLLLAAQMPFTLLAITLGGVSMAQVVATYCTLGAYLFFLGNLGLLASVIARDTLHAALITAAVLAAANLGGVVFSVLLPALYHTAPPTPGSYDLLSELAGVVADLTPRVRLNEILTTGFHEPPFGAQFWCSVTAGLVCFLVAWMAFDRCTDSASATSQPLDRRLGWKPFAPGRPEAFRAIEWKDTHFLHGGRMAFVARLIAYPSLAALLIWVEDMPLAFGRWGETGAAVATLFAAGVALELGWAVSRAFSSELRGQTMASLTLLPISVEHIYWAKTSACHRTIAPGGSYFVLSVLCASLGGIASDPLLIGMAAIVCLFIVAVAAALIMLFANTVAYLSLRMKRGALILTVVLWCATAAVGIVSLEFAGLLLVFVSPFVCATLVPFLKLATIRRLEHLASEG